MYKIELEVNGKGGAKGKLDFTYNVINEKGNKLVEKNVEEKIHIMLTVLNALLQHYCETNELLSSSELRKMIPLEEKLSIKEKTFMVLNRLAELNMKDKVRDRFMKTLVNGTIAN